jgi:hypothetical protein
MHNYNSDVSSIVLLMHSLLVSFVSHFVDALLSSVNLEVICFSVKIKLRINNRRRTDLLEYRFFVIIYSSVHSIHESFCRSYFLPNSVYPNINITCKCIVLNEFYV